MLHDHTQTHHTRWDSSGRVISPMQRPLSDNTQHSQHPSMSTAGFEHVIPTSERPQTHTLDRAATGIGIFYWDILGQLLKIKEKSTRKSASVSTTSCQIPSGKKKKMILHFVYIISTLLSFFIENPKVWLKESFQKIARIVYIDVSLNRPSLPQQK